ncbi:UDP-N-acetylglucosamine 2-epimerase [Rossellomorea vietnamensis]|uniref:UDP-N-acetylglucosamine 2-epimerase (non-hydrolyzing) n=2 Tax=Rossellomorea vietnamensis TaxID=218284 RepID=A0A0P6VXJ8_9BACI|nr:UDP-N-acetylglucosamine 2-epimerase [Rossellomorea vietnamensis]
MAPLITELKNRPLDFEVKVAVTGQHREMLDQMLQSLKIKTDFDLDIMDSRQSLSQITSRAMEGIDKILSKTKPDLLLVHGDTTTALSAALAGYYRKIPVGHVEAGLRTMEKYSPFPEELNRQIIARISDLHFAPTNLSKENLLRENISKEKIFVTGNTAIDTLRLTVKADYVHDVLTSMGDKRLILMTVHRRENIENMVRIFRAVKRLIREHKDIQVVFPVHLNPVIQEHAEKLLGEEERIQLIKPMNVFDFHNVCARSYLIMTDSGGLQEEAPALGIPVIVLRDTTERPEGVNAGTLRLAGTHEDTIWEVANELIISEEKYHSMVNAVNPYGDGKASYRIAESILYQFKKRDERPLEFDID